MLLKDLIDTNIFMKDLEKYGLNSSEIKECVSEGIDTANNWIQLWSHWYSTFGSIDDDFISERFQTLSKEKSTLLLKKIYKIDTIIKNK
tara:strand:+ start:271 stop:537 length:267 start_codon:yes stop_codon:yes gene_type:complete